MLFTWDTTNLCIVFRQWHVRGPTSLIFSLLAIIALCAGYEALREAIRRYEQSIATKQDASLSEYLLFGPTTHTYTYTYTHSNPRFTYIPSSLTCLSW